MVQKVQKFVYIIIECPLYKILQFLQDLISIHNAENWLGMDDDLGGPMSTSNVQPSTASPPQNKALGLAGNSNPIQANLSNKLRSDTPDSAIVTDFNHHRMRSVDSPSSSSPTSTASNASINGDHGKFKYSSLNIGQLSK